jgi:hypothetical protein
MCQDPSGRTWQSAYQEFELGEVNVDNLELRLMPPFEIHGRIDWDGPAAPVGQGRKLRLQPFIKWAESESTEIDDNGTFVFAEAAPGRYEVRLAGMPENAYVKSVRQGPMEMPNQILDVRQGPSGPVAITLNPRGARISGIVSDLKGAVAEASVGLVGEEPVGFDFFRTSRTGADGAYSFHGLPPGTYRVFVFDSEDYEHLRKNRALPFYANPVEKIEVAEGDNISRDLKLDGGMRLMP